MVDISEKNFEQTIEAALIGEAVQESFGGASPGRESTPAYGTMSSGGYRKRVADDYDKRLCLIAADVQHFIYATQPKEWDPHTGHTVEALSDDCLKGKGYRRR